MKQGPVIRNVRHEQRRREAMIRVVLLLLLIVGFAADRAVAVGPPLLTQEECPVIMKLYYVPFSALTFVPMTIERISTNANFFLWFMMDDILIEQGTNANRFVERVRRLLSARPVEGKLDQLNIRLKVEFVCEGTTWYADAIGRVLNNKNETSELSKEDARHLDKEIESFAGVVDMKANRHLYDLGVLKQTKED